MALSADDRLRFDSGGMLLEVIREGTTSTLQLFGECDLSQKETLRAAVREVFGTCPEHIVLDLSRLSFIDSTGIQVVIEACQRAGDKNVRLEICAGSGQVAEVFELCALTTFLPFVSDDEGARGSRETPQCDT
jgi:stage II sporulation protein AA (anti-sigma F factor antagonist)